MMYGHVYFNIDDVWTMCILTLMMYGHVYFNIHYLLLHEFKLIVHMILTEQLCIIIRLTSINNRFFI